MNFFPRKPVPPGFYAEKRNKKTFYCCAKTKQIGKITLTCTVAFRQDRFVPYHRHNFMDIRRFNEVKKKGYTKYGLSIKQFQTFGKLNISILASTSNEIRELLQFAYECGQVHVSLPFDKFFPKISRRRYTQRFISYARELKHDKLYDFHRKFASLAVDAGKINGVSYLTVIVINTNYKPVVIKNERYFGGKAKNYREVIENEIENLKHDDIQITAIVADNQRAQKAAISQENANSIQRNSSKQFIKGITFVPSSAILWLWQLTT